MKYRELGRTGLEVSVLSFGASSLGGVFKKVSEADGIEAVHTALELGINYFDVAPAYGGTVAEQVLGKALRDVPRDQYVLSTKVGKYTDPNAYGADTFDYSDKGIRRSLEQSSERLGTGYFDLVHLHDIEYEGGKHTEWALSEGYETLHTLKKAGHIGGVSFGMFPIDLWRRVFEDYEADAGLVHNHYCLNNTQLLDLLPIVREKGIGLINASPFASGLLTERGAPDWHPATKEDRELFARAAAYCREHGTEISKLALQFATNHAEIPTTLFSSANPDSVRRNVQWWQEPLDESLVEGVREILAPVLDKEWPY
jgi:aryl-alcohol dehydrogenase-like predicted oxidoreductase